MVTPPGQINLQAGNPTMTSEDGYTRIECHGTTRIRPGNGQTLENLLVVNNGHNINFNGRGLNSYTIRNVGVTDPIPGHVGQIFSFGSSGSSLLDTIYIGEGDRADWTDKHQGANNGQSESKGGFSFGEHTGETTVRNVYAGPFADNIFYCENQGSNGNFHFENCYTNGGCISVFRTGGGGSHTMRNCHANNAGQHPVNGHGGSRDVWIRSGQSGPSLDIYDSQLGGAGSGIVAQGGPVRLHGSTQYGGGTGNIIHMDSSVGTNPNPQIPSTVPTTALEAATGQAGGDPDPEPEPGGFSIDVESPSGQYTLGAEPEWLIDLENTSDTESDIDLSVESGGLDSDATVTIPSGGTDDYRFFVETELLGEGEYTWELTATDGFEDVTLTGFYTVVDMSGEPDPPEEFTYELGVAAVANDEESDMATAEVAIDEDPDVPSGGDPDSDIRQPGSVWLRYDRPPATD